MGPLAGDKEMRAMQATPYALPPQKDHHLGFAVIETPGTSGGDEGRRKERKISEQQKSERR